MSSMPLRSRIALAIAPALLAACAALPDLPVPDASGLPGAFVGAAGLPAGVTAAADWWTALGDATLDRLIERGLAANLDLQQAAERVERSRALAGLARAARGPSGGVGLGASARQAAEVEAPGASAADRRSDTVNAGIGLSWELDLFGRLRDQAAAAAARADAATADADGLRLAVSAEIAEAWYALCGAREELALLHDIVDSRRATAELIDRRVRGGLAAPIDAARAKAELAAAEAEVPARTAALTVATNRLAVLLGETPSTFAAPAEAAAAPDVRRLVVPDPVRWLPMRADLRAAEAQLRAQALDVAAVRADFMPRFTVTGALGFVAGTASGLGSAGSASWFVAPGVSLPVFDRARIASRLAAAEAGQRELLLAYRQRILVAVEEVENALVRIREAQAELVARQQRVVHAGEAEDYARKRYAAGASDLLELLDAQRGAQAARLGLASALMTQRRDVVALYRAIGARFVPAAGA